MTHYTSLVSRAKTPDSQVAQGSLSSPPILMVGGFSTTPWFWRREFALFVSCGLSPVLEGVTHDTSDYLIGDAARTHAAGSAAGPDGGPCATSGHRHRRAVRADRSPGEFSRCHQSSGSSTTASLPALTPVLFPLD